MGFFDDKPRTEPAYQKSREQYTDEFVAALAADYGFDHTNIDVLSDLYEIAFRYRIARKTEGEENALRERRENMKKLQRTFRKFLRQLEENGGDYFNLEVHKGARLSGDLNPNLDPADYPGRNFSKNYCYWFEFERYLTFFDRGLEATIERDKSRGGRPTNRGLENAMDYITGFWIDIIGKKFTLDYHYGTGTSEAFHFVKRLIDPIEDVPDNHIVSAMRRWIKREREYERNLMARFYSQQPQTKID